MVVKIWFHEMGLVNLYGFGVFGEREMWKVGANISKSPVLLINLMKYRCLSCDYEL